MTKKELIDNAAKITGKPRKTCEEVLNAMIGEVVGSLADGEDVKIKGFAYFEIAERKERKARNPRTGEIETYPAVKVVKCRAGQNIKEAVKRK